jgi:hypothetical protein
MDNLLIPFLPGCKIQIFTRENPESEIIWVKSGCEKRDLKGKTGELSYENIISICKNTPFRIRGFEEEEFTVVRIIVPWEYRLKVFGEKNDPERAYTTLVSRNHDGELPYWVNKLPWFERDCSKVTTQVITKENVGKKETELSKTEQTSDEQHWSEKDDPPFREGDAIFWR